MDSFVALGFPCVKMKVGKRFGCVFDEDVERVRAVRGHVGPKIRLAVDANQIHAVPEAIAFARAIADQDIAWFEEPVHSADYLGLKAFCEESPIVAGVGESERTALGFDSIAAAGCRHLQPQTSLPGVQEILSVCRYADAHKLDLSAGGLSYFTSQIMAVNSESVLTEILLPVVGPLRPYLKTAPDLKDGRFILDSERAVSTSIDWELLAEKNGIASDEVFTPDDFRNTGIPV